MQRKISNIFRDQHTQTFALSSIRRVTPNLQICTLFVKYKQEMLHINAHSSSKSLNYHLHAHPLSQVEILSFNLCLKPPEKG